jgi:hypothetical protein
MRNFTKSFGEKQGEYFEAAAGWLHNTKFLLRGCEKMLFYE